MDCKVCSRIGIQKILIIMQDSLFAQCPTCGTMVEVPLTENFYRYAAESLSVNKNIAKGLHFRIEVEQTVDHEACERDQAEQAYQRATRDFSNTAYNREWQHDWQNPYTQPRYGYHVNVDQVVVDEFRRYVEQEQAKNPSIDYVYGWNTPRDKETIDLLEKMKDDLWHKVQEDIDRMTRKGKL